MTPPDLVGLAGIAELLGVAKDTPAKWRTRGILPAPLTVVSGVPLWDKARIIDWHETRRGLPER